MLMFYNVVQNLEKLEIYREIETFRIALCPYTEFMRACRTAHNTRIA